MDLNRGPGVVPASCLSEVSGSSPAALRQNFADDFDLVNQGIISLDDAERFFNLYYCRLDHFLYRILAEHDSLACYQNFVHLASSRMFSKKNSHDDIRALCIGAFWLNDISWTLVGTGMTPKTIACQKDLLTV